MFTSPVNRKQKGGSMVNSKNAVGVASTYDISRKVFRINYNTAGRGDANPSGLRATLPDATLDRMFAPVWETLSRVQGRILFQALGQLIGDDCLFTLLGASYIRFLSGKAVI